MHIIIDIKDTEVSVKQTESSQISNTELNDPATMELLAAAAATGALNAGRAPVDLESQATQQPVESSAEASNTDSSNSSSGESAGAATEAQPEL